MSEDIVGLAHGMLDAVQESGCTPTAWWMSPKVAVQIADYFGMNITIPEGLTSLLGLPVQVDPTAIGIVLLRERPGIRVAHNDPISDTPERILSDLIAELRAQHYADQCECGCEQWYECEPCSHVSLCPTQEAAVRAEARLREVQGE